jgi:hypothetical protein
VRRIRPLNRRHHHDDLDAGHHDSGCGTGHHNDHGGTRPIYNREGQ